MTKFNFIPSIPGLGATPEKRFAPEVLSIAFYGRKPKIAGAVVKLRLVAASNPGIAPAITQVGAQPGLSLVELDQRDRLRQAVAGNSLLAPALKDDTSQEDWSRKLDIIGGSDQIMQPEISEQNRIAELERIAKREADNYEYPRAA
jgi:hypothetical protein